MSHNASASWAGPSAAHGADRKFTAGGKPLVEAADFCSETDQRWRDLFPIPLIPESRAVRARNPVRSSSSVASTRNEGRRKHNLAVANQVITATNEMYDASSSLSTHSGSTLAQRKAQNSILDAVVKNQHSKTCMTQQEAVHELLLESHLYTDASCDSVAPTTVRSYDRAKVSLPDVNSAPVPQVLDIIDPHGREILKDAERTMLSGDATHRGERPKIYMDDALKRDKRLYIQFVVDLYKRNMIRFSETCASVITPFFVIKKDGRLRLVLDCRETNLLFKESPNIAMAAGYSFSQLEVPQDQCLYIAQSDIKDYFYSLGLPQDLQKFFALPMLKRSDLLGAGIPADALPLCDNIYPMFLVVPMGWSWAMWIAQRVHSHQAAIAAGLDESRIVADGRPTPCLASGQPALLPYADNNNVVGTNREEVQATRDRIVKHFQSLGFRVHEEVDACDMATSLGFLIDGRRGLIRPNPVKVDKVIKALLWLKTRPRVSGRAIERIIGHCVHFFMLKRELLSIFRAMYDYKACNYHSRPRLWAMAAAAAGWAAALLHVCFADLKKAVVGGCDLLRC